MKKLFFAVILFLIVITAFGCSNNKGYSSKEAVKRGDIVYQQSKVAHLTRFEQFLTNLSNKKKIRYE